jgi:hypothetical protein
MATDTPETGSALVAWRTFLELGPGRSLAATVEAMGRKPSYRGLLARWSAANDWQGRAAAHDQQELRACLAGRSEIRERALQQLVDAAGRASQIVLEILDDVSCVPVLDRHGRQVGERPRVAASTKLEAAKWIHGVLGIQPVRRLELEVKSPPTVSDVADRILDSVDSERIAQIRALLTPAAPVPEEPTP